MHTNTDITLIGGGIIGLMTAREFNRASVSVTVIDKGISGRESSWAGGGILLPIYPWRQDPAVFALVADSLRFYADIADDLYTATGINPERYQCGMLITQNPDIATVTDWLNRYNLAYQPPEAIQLEGLITDLNNPLWLPTIAQIRNPHLLAALRQDLIDNGVTLIENFEISRIQIENGRVVALQSESETIAINELIITTGAWTHQLFETFFTTLNAKKPEIAPVRGQMLLYAAEPDTLKTMVLDGDHYLIPRLDGHILAGSTVEDTINFEKITTPEGQQELNDFALTLLPKLNDFPLVKHWAGLRPGTPNGIPYIARHPEIENLSLNAGHFRNGLAMAPASAKLIVDIILNRPTSVDPGAYRMNRLD